MSFINTISELVNPLQGLTSPSMDPNNIEPVGTQEQIQANFLAHKGLYTFAGLSLISVVLSACGASPTPDSTSELSLRDMLNTIVPTATRVPKSTPTPNIPDGFLDIPANTAFKFCHDPRVVKLFGKDLLVDFFTRASIKINSVIASFGLDDYCANPDRTNLGAGSIFRIELNAPIKDVTP